MPLNRTPVRALSEEARPASGRFASLIFLTLSLASVAACASAPPAPFVEASPRTVLSRIEIAEDGETRNVIIDNRSSQEVFVISIGLRECRNINTTCGDKPVRTTVAPGERRTLLTVKPAIRASPVVFRHTTAWSVAPPSAGE